MLDRRAFLTGMAGVVATPLVATAQPAGKIPRIGYLGYGPPGSDPSGIAGLRQGFRALGYVEDQNIRIEYRYAAARADRLRGLITELQGLKIDVLLAQGTAAATAAKEAATVPVIFVAGDPVGAGIVQSLARPGGNITGLSFGSGEGFSGKWLELVREAVPNASRVGIMWNPSNQGNAASLKEMETLAPGLGLRLQSHTVGTSQDIDTAFAAMARERLTAVIIQTDPLVVSQAPRIVKLAALSRLPSIYGLREFVDAGGFASYGPNLSDLWRRAAGYVDKILKGTKASDLPIEQASKYELVINLKTAKALDLTIPQSLLLRADQVIQ